MDFSMDRDFIIVGWKSISCIHYFSWLEKLKPTQSGGG